MSNDYLLYLCPSCNERTEYIPNPAYMHICKSCGHETTQSKLVNAIDIKKAEKRIGTLEDEISRIREYQQQLPAAPEK